MDEVKGMAVLRASLKIAKTAVLVVLLWGLLDLLGVKAGPFLGPVIDVLRAGAIADLLVFAFWNIAASGQEAGEERIRARIDADLRRAASWQPPRLPPGKSLAAVKENMSALHRALAAGTVSVNGMGLWPEEAMAVLSGQAVLDGVHGHLKYVGPPPVFTPPHGLIQAVPGADVFTSASVLRVVKSECDWCGVPVDVAWCTPGATYLCRSCREDSSSFNRHYQT